MADLLLELFSEEIPARMQTDASMQLEEAVTKRLKEAGLSFDTAKNYSTPRRITLHLTGLPLEQPDVREERKGPRVGAPEKAIEGFLRGAGLDSIDACETREDKKGAYYVAVIEKKGGKTADVIAKLVPEVVRGFHWPKSMRWGSGTLRWVRPLHSILCTLDGAVVPFDVDGIQSGDVTYGHRFHAPSAIKAPTIDAYLDGLANAHVILRRTERKAKIWAEAQKLASDAGLEVTEDAPLLREVTGLVEWPVVLMGTFDEDFLDVPPEVLITAMRSHQKYFAVRDPKTGKLANKFIFVANLDAQDGGKAITAGNERVLRARLSDAKFFWDQDRKVKLEDRVEKLQDIVFYDKLGTVYDKVQRVRALAREIAPLVGADPDKADRAALLAKADLVTDMVYEFPELQGLMGRYYALEQGEPEDIADAIRDHYSPVGPSDKCPTEPTSIAIALADKLDTIVNFWRIEEKPTGSKDPFALRRAAIGVLRLILQNELRISLMTLSAKVLGATMPQDRQRFILGQLEAFAEIKVDKLSEAAVGELLKSALSEARSQFGSQKNPFNPPETALRILTSMVTVSAGVRDFILERLRIYLRDQGRKHDIVDASTKFHESGNLVVRDDLVLICRLVDALGAFLNTDDGKNLLAGYKRAVNILRIEEKKDGTSYSGAADQSLLEEDAEKALYAAIKTANGAVETALAAEDFTAAMAAVAQLRGPVDRFFEDVTVNADKADLRTNRLKLLSQIRDALGGVADFSKIEG